MEDKDEVTPEQTNHDDLTEVEAIMGPAPEFPQAAADIQKISDSKSKAKANASSKKKPGKSSKITVSFDDDTDSKDSTQNNSDTTPEKTAGTTKKGIVVKDFADETPELAVDKKSDDSQVAPDDETPESTAVIAKSDALPPEEPPKETLAKPAAKTIAIKSFDEDISNDASVSDSPVTAPPIIETAKPPTPAPVRPPTPTQIKAEVTRPPQPAQKLTAPPPPNPRAALQAPPAQPIQPAQPLVRPVRPPAMPVQPTLNRQKQPAPPPLPKPLPQKPTMVASPAPPRESIMRSPAKSGLMDSSAKKPRKSFFKIAAVRWILVLVIIFGLLGVGLAPSTRYPLLNMAGVRVAASLVVMDDKTSLPLKNVSVKVEDKEAKTDEEGKVNFDGLKLGKQEFKIEKIGFETVTKYPVLGWGSNPLGEYRVNAVGAQYQFVVKDWLSQKPIAKAEVISGDASAFTDANGVAMLTVDKELEGDMNIAVSANGYRTEKQTINAQDKSEHTQILVPSKQHYFVSKRTGKYDIYKVDIDGKNEQLVVSGTGLETEDIKLVPHPTRPIAALVASRENVRNEGGYLNSGIYVVDFATNELEKISQSERIDLIGWIDNSLVYAKIAEGASNTDPRRHRLMSYNFEDGSDKELASSNYFNDVLSLNGYIYYAPSNAFQENPNAQLYRVKPDGGEQISIVNKEVWNLFRISYDLIDVMQHQDWYQFKIGDTLASKQTVAPTNPNHRIYVDNPAASKSLWIDERDGQGVLMVYDVATKQDTVLYSKIGLTYPVRWLTDDYIVFRISAGSEQADYVMYVGGKEPIKVRDVSNSSYIGRWVYF